MTENMTAEGGKFRLHCILTARVAKESVFFGPGPYKLLASIDETGSIEAAVRKTGISYSKARKIIKQMEHEMEFAMVIRQPGGLKGGSSRLTDEGIRFLRLYQDFQNRLNEAGIVLFRACFAEYMPEG
jgi:molybdate transport system regulatory protein